MPSTRYVRSSRTSAGTRSPGLLVAIGLTYLTVILVAFAAGYLVGQVLL
jgi:hypothetical protein